MKKIFDDGTYETWERTSGDWEKRESWLDVLMWVMAFGAFALVVYVLLGGLQ
jgi:hypothetical protein